MIIQKQRDNIFTLLRGYHEAPVLLQPSTTEMDLLLHDLETMADKIISMVLGLVRGDEDFKDWSMELKAFAVKVNPTSTHSDAEKKERVLVGEKINQLAAVIKLAQKAT